MKTRIVSFHQGNLNPNLLTAQKAVFDKFGLPLEQIKTSFSHPAAIDHFLDKEAWDVMVLFDADCIPLNGDVIQDAIEGCIDHDRIIAAAQKASHIPNSQIYASPCFMVLTKKVYEMLGRPSFHATDRGDVAEELSYAAREKGIYLDLIMPDHVETPLWPLTPEIKFGYGTNYGNKVYHAFESNANHRSTGKFIEKCREILGIDQQ